MIIKSNALRAYAALGLVMLFWAGNSITGRAVRDDIPPFTLAFLRWALGFVFLLPFAPRRMAEDRAAIRSGWQSLLVLGILGVACFNGFLYSALHHTSATNALLLQAAIPAGVLLADRLLFGLSATMGRIAAVLLSTAGVLLVVIRGDIAVLARLDFGLGDMLMLCGVIAWSLYTSLLRRRPAVHPLSLVAVTFLIGAACMAPFALGEWISGDRPAAGIGVIAAVLYVAIFPSILGYMLFNDAVARIGAGPAGQMISLMPLLGALMASLLLNEALHLYHLAGMTLILGGIALTVVLARRSAD
jgi:drug/metabolite transporter (DMT)-like permease